MSSARVRYWTALAGAAALVGACNQMLGIDDASVDARLSAVGHGAASASGTTASGGSSATAGKAGATVGGGGSGAAAGTHSHGAGSGAGGNDAGSAGSDETPEPQTGGTAGHAMGGTHSGSGSAGKTSSDTGGEGGETTGPSADPCDDYCDEMQSECTGEAEQYRDRAQCMKICHFFPLGDEEGEDDNSVACRLKYVKKTEYGLGAEVTAYCRQAGPSGDGKCGTTCEAFCSVMMQVCTEDTAGPNHFANEAACLAACNGLPAPTVHYSNNDPAVSDGDHALCRLFHVNSAAMADPEEHCEHAMGITLCQAAP
jgi:hypothetical protein